MTTGFKTKDMDSILLLRWKNDVDGVRNSNVPWTKYPKPLELVVKELGL